MTNLRPAIVIEPVAVAQPGFEVFKQLACKAIVDLVPVGLGLLEELPCDGIFDKRSEALKQALVDLGHGEQDDVRGLPLAV